MRKTGKKTPDDEVSNTFLVFCVVLFLFGVWGAITAIQSLHESSKKARCEVKYDTPECHARNKRNHEIREAIKSLQEKIE